MSMLLRNGPRNRSSVYLQSIWFVNRPNFGCLWVILEMMSLTLMTMKYPTAFRLLCRRLNTTLRPLNEVTSIKIPQWVFGEGDPEYVTSQKFSVVSQENEEINDDSGQDPEGATIEISQSRSNMISCHLTLPTLMLDKTYWTSCYFIRSWYDQIAGVGWSLWKISSRYPVEGLTSIIHGLIVEVARVTVRKRSWLPCLHVHQVWWWFRD